MKRYLKTPEEVIDVLKEGKTVKCTDGSEYTVDSGFLVEKSKGTWSINPTLYGLSDYYAEEPKPLRLEVGKFYKTRAGRKVWITYAIKDEHEYYPFCCIVLGGNEVYYVNEQGFVVSTETSELDLVAPWEE